MDNLAEKVDKCQPVLESGCVADDQFLVLVRYVTPDVRLCVREIQ